MTGLREIAEFAGLSLFLDESARINPELRSINISSALGRVPSATNGKAGN
jgi:hypothetical protein